MNRRSVTYRFDTREFEATLQKAVQAGLQAAADAGASLVRDRVGVRHGGVPSKPGQPWNSQTNEARGSIFGIITGKGQAAFGSPVQYVKWLEYGTVKMAPRPVFVPLYDELRKRGKRYLLVEGAFIKGAKVNLGRFAA